MADDIVTRLRKLCRGEVASYRDCPYCQAADEIERLREEVDTLSKVIRKLNGDGVVYFRDEAVRGG